MHSALTGSCRRWNTSAHNVRARCSFARWTRSCRSTTYFCHRPVAHRCGVTNLTGHPAISLKAGFIDNRPIELMVTGRLYDEATILRVALAYERGTEWHKKNPVLLGSSFQLRASSEFPVRQRSGNWKLETGNWQLTRITLDAAPPSGPLVTRAGRAGIRRTLTR